MAGICVVGLWHQGSVVSACLADMGHHVRGVGDDEQAARSLNAAQPQVYEPQLEEVLGRNLASGRLRYTTHYGEALQDAEFVYIAIDTPVGPDDEPDMTSIFDAARSVSRNLSGDVVVCVSAQVPVGTCGRLAETVREQNPTRHAEIAYVPEFLQLGTAVDVFRHPDRIVIGAQNGEVAGRIAKLYEPLSRPIVITDIRTAEMAKHASNAFLATSISFINEIATVCEEVGADVLDVARIMKLDRRIGEYAFLTPGLGFAGGTLGREIRAIQKLGRGQNSGTPLMDAVMKVNLERGKVVSRRLARIYGSLEGLNVGVLGLTYKAGTSTLRRSVALEIIRDLISRGVRVKAFDPMANLSEARDLPPFLACHDPYDVAQDSDGLVLATDWPEFRDLDLSRLRGAMRRPVFIDTRNVLDPSEMLKLGFVYSGIGRGIAIGGARG